MSNSCGDVQVFVVGDFNAHVGQLQCGNVEFDDNMVKCKVDGYVSKLRFSSCTAKVDARGQSVNRFCNANNLCMLNGRCKSDM